MTFIRPILKHIATLGPVGYLPLMPGTFGSLIALIFVALIKPSTALHITVTVVLIIIGLFASHEAEGLMARADPPPVVIDEFAGYLVSMAFLPQGKGWLVASFVLFRAFDILKPLPVHMVQRLPGGWGIMADDLMAGIYTNLILQIWRVAWKS